MKSSSEIFFSYLTIFDNIKSIILSMESVLGANCRMPLIHMSNRKFWIEETNQRISEFPFAYMLNPIFNKNKAFKDQVKSCLSNTFGADTNKHIN